jgi:broad specificity phosphatase PhoE
MPERYVHLVRHGLPTIDHEVPASEWSLDPAAMQAVRDLRTSGRLPERASWFTSPEPKARETARLLTDDTVVVVDGLREQVRLHVGWIDDFDGVLSTAFAAPDTPAYDGWEPLAATGRRAADAVRTLLREHPTGDLVLVGHGTSLALVAAELTGAPVNPSSPAAMDFPDVITVRMQSTARPGPLGLSWVLAAAGAVTLVELVVWLTTGTPGYVLAPAAIVACLVAAPRQTRDVGVSLIAAVLLASFLMLGLVNFVPRLQS